MLNDVLWDTLAAEIDSDLRGPVDKEVVVGHECRKQPRGAKKERPGLDSEGRSRVLDGMPCE